MSTRCDSDAAPLAAVPISLHCWQGDDVEGFEKFGTGLGGGLAATGNYPGKAKTPDELRSDAALALSLIPGTHRFNLHASYGEFGGKTRRSRRDRPRTLSPAGSTGRSRWASASTSTRPTSRTRRRRTASRSSHPRHGDPPVLDRSRHRLPARRRGDGQGARQAVRHQPLDPRRHEGHADRSRRAARSG